MLHWSCMSRSVHVRSITLMLSGPKLVPRGDVTRGDCRMHPTSEADSECLTGLDQYVLARGCGRAVTESLSRRHCHREDEWRRLHGEWSPCPPALRLAASTAAAMTAPLARQALPLLASGSGHRIWTFAVDPPSCFRGSTAAAVRRGSFPGRDAADKALCLLPQPHPAPDFAPPLGRVRPPGAVESEPSRAEAAFPGCCTSKACAS